jgi:hypothetical protein
MEPIPEVTYLVGISHESDHYKLEEELKEWSKSEGISILPAFDGMEINLLQ